MPCNLSKSSPTLRNGKDKSKEHFRPCMLTVQSDECSNTPVVSISFLYALYFIIAPDKTFLSSKNTDIFLTSPWKHMLLYSLKASRWDAFNEYQQHMFSWRNKKNIMWILPLILSYADYWVVLWDGQHDPIWPIAPGKRSIRMLFLNIFLISPQKHVFMEKEEQMSHNKRKRTF